MKFIGLTDAQWDFIEEFIPTKNSARARGRPPANPRHILNSICWILITRARWCDLPRGSQWGSRTASNRWMGMWQKNGTLEKVLVYLQEFEELAEMIDFDRLVWFFLCRQRRRKKKNTY